MREGDKLRRLRGTGAFSVGIKSSLAYLLFMYAAPEKCRFEWKGPDPTTLRKVGDEGFLLPIIHLRYRPTGSEEIADVEVPYSGDEEVRRAFWGRVRRIAQDDPSPLGDEARGMVAADIWVRVFFKGTVQQNVFKKVYWKRFLKHIRLVDMRCHHDPFPKAVIDTLVDAGEKKLKKGIPPLGVTLARLHFTELTLKEARPEAARKFLAEHAAEIYELERKCVTTAGYTEGSRLQDKDRADVDKKVRKRLEPLRRACSSEELTPEAVGLEALAQLLQSMDTFYEGMALDMEGHIEPLAMKLFRVFHIAGPRVLSGAVPPIPLHLSDTLRSAFEFICGIQTGEWSFPEAVIAPDLVAVLDGADPMDDRYRRSVAIALGFVEHFRSWVFDVREDQRKQKEEKRHPRPMEWTDVVEEREEAERRGKPTTTE